MNNSLTTAIQNQKIMKTKIHFFFLLSLISLSSFAQTPRLFVDVSDNVGLPYLEYVARWYDIDNDGNIDVFSPNYDGGTIYLNNSGQFEASPIFVPFGYDFNFIDINKDPYIDFIVDGTIYVNQLKQFASTRVVLDEIPDAILDVNNDGFQDIIVNFNKNESDNALGVYLNDKNENFNLAQTIRATVFGEIRLLDYNKDGRMDFMIENKLFSNYNNLFYNTHTIPYDGDYVLNSILNDFNGDGETDVILSSYQYDPITGNNSSNIQIFFDNNNVFEEHISYKQAGYVYMLGVADLTGDGTLEILLSETINNVSATNIYTIDEKLIPVSSIPTSYYEAEFYDYDQDGDLDFLLDGRLYQNQINYKNVAPAAPKNLVASVSGNTATLSWDGSDDSETPSASLLYNVSVINPLGITVHPYANDIDGRIIDRELNAGTNKFLVVRDLPLGKYVWKVQAMDQGLQTSKFSMADTFEITNGIIDPIQYEHVKQFDILYGDQQKEFMITIFDDVAKSLFGQTIDGSTFQKTSEYKRLLNVADLEEVKLLDDNIHNSYHIIYKLPDNSFGFQSLDKNLNALDGAIVKTEPVNNITYLLGATLNGDYLQIMYLDMSLPTAGNQVDIFLKIVQHSLNSNLPDPPIKEIKVGEYQINSGTTLIDSGFEGELEEMGGKNVSIVWSLNTTIQYNPTEPLSGGLEVLTLDKSQLSITDEFVISPTDSVAEYIAPKVDYNYYNQEVYVSWIKTQTDRNGTFSDPYDFSEVYGKQLKLSEDFNSYTSASPDIQMSQSNVQGNTNIGAVDFELFHNPDRNDYFVLWENNNLSDPTADLGIISTLNVDPYGLEVSNPLDSAFLSIPASRPFVVYNPDDQSYLLLWYHDQANEGVTVTKYKTPKDPRIKLNSIDPETAYAGQKVIIEGQNFGKTPYLNNVFFGGLPAAVDTVFFSENMLQVTVPNGLTSEEVPIFVSFDGQGETSLGSFEFGAKLPPRIDNTTISNPATCGNVTFKGQFFSRDSILSVTFNGIPVETDDIVTATESVIACLIPQGVEGTTNVVIQTDDRMTEIELAEPIHLGADIKGISSDEFIGHIPDFPSSAQLRLSVFNDCSVDKLELHYRGITSENSWEIISDPAVLRRDADNYYLTNIGDDFFQDPIGLEYFFNITDKSGASVISDTLKIYRKFLGKDSLNNISNFIDFFGKSAESYRLVSVPFSFDNNAVSEVFGDLTRLHGGDTKQWRLFKYDTDFVEITASDDEVNPGVGFAIISRKKSDSFFTDGTTVDLGDGEFKIILKPGWNLVGNPFPTDLNWGTVLNHNGNPPELGTPLILENGWQSVPGNFVFKKFSGIAIQNKGNQDIEFKFPQKASSFSRIASANEEYLWNANITLNTDNFSCSNIRIGMHASANSDIDMFDEMQAPRFINYLELNSKQLAHEGKYSRDITNYQPNYTWDFYFEDNLGSDSYKMSWNLEDLNNKLWLFDRLNNKLLNMEEKSEYTFSKAEEFQFIFGDQSYLMKQISPTFSSVGELFPNPVNSQANIQLFISENSIGEEITFRIHDVSGRLRNEFKQYIYAPYQLMNIETSDLPKGFYLLNVEINHKVYSKKLIKN
jgi:hypothetical protein